MKCDILTIFPDFFTGPFDHGVLAAPSTDRPRRSPHARPPRLHPRPSPHRRRPPLRRRRGHGPQARTHLRLLRNPRRRPPIATRDTSAGDRHPPLRAGPPLHPVHRRTSSPSRLDRIVFLCGRYEGVDERVNHLLCDRELSIGDYVLSGGELAAAVIVDAVVRLLPGVLGNPDSARHESFGADDDRRRPLSPRRRPPATHGAGGLLDYPHYTRPADFRGHSHSRRPRPRRPRRNPPLALANRPSASQNPPQPSRPP